MKINFSCESIVQLNVNRTCFLNLELNRRAIVSVGSSSPPVMSVVEEILSILSDEPDIFVEDTEVLGLRFGIAMESVFISRVSEPTYMYIESCNFVS